MNRWVRLPGNLLRIIFLRGSPERILYSRRLFLVVLVAAVAASALVQIYYFRDHTTFVILRVFAELTVFMVWMVLLTAKVARLRLASLMLVLLLISLFGDSVLLLLSPLPLADVARPLGLIWGIALLYGAGNATSWALRKPLSHGCLQSGLYGLFVVGLDLAFRGLYEIVAAG